MKELRFSKDFLMGTSVASVMIEGGNKNTNWYKWCEDGNIRDGSHIIRGTDHWNRYEEDIDIMKQLYNDTHCMTIEWSRVETSRGHYDMEAVKCYRKQIEKLIECNIRPVLEVFHFSQPQWFDDMGGWLNPESVQLFVDYTKFVIEQFGDLVSEWITFNDLSMTLYCCYLLGWFPPGMKDDKKVYAAMRSCVEAHIKCYELIHKIRKERNFKGETKVGIAHHFKIYDPYKKNILNKLSSRLINYITGDMLFQALMTGKMGRPIGKGDYPFGKGRFYDFIGVNYWTREIDKFVWKPDSLFCEQVINTNGHLTDGGWEIYPEGIYRVCKDVYEKYQAPIYIIQNGLREPVDKDRAYIISKNLKYVHKLIEEGIPVERYYIWSLTDIFECHEGESAKLGIVHIDFETQKRTVKKSGEMYGEICKNKCITEEIINKYLTPEQVKRFNED
ncbi:glycoside hydrolase family 1 protein [Cellulosilyticum ruminicola]|uniref:glycoside hydrolase family 1 protein n=1 Tax=Cellulosilyticum ruminicola TaxID=425254 RepID=UPI0006D14F09|nr:family 1 glycosylhydrolase [Cellulosilyticum ruminicola]